MHLQHLNTYTQLSSSLPPNYLFSISSDSPKFHSKPNPRRTSISFTVRASKSNAGSQTLLPRTAIQRIAEKLRNLGFADGDSREKNDTSKPSTSSAGEIFVPLPSHLPRRRVGHTIDTSWSSPDIPVPAPGTGNAFGRFRELKREVRVEKMELKAATAGMEREERESVPTLAELTLPPAELRRLRRVGIETRKKLKIGKAGITEGIVNGIHERWRRTEIVKIECEDLCRMNMKRTHDMLEKKTGGLVVWRSGSKIVLYRGTKYVYPYFFSDGTSRKDTGGPEDGDQIKTVISSDPDRATHQNPPNKTVRPGLIQGVGLQQRVRFELPGEAKITEEADRLLDGLGPRFSDWWGPDPLPVDADLLPPVVHGYRRPFRLLPYGVFPKLTNHEMTMLRRLARPIPIHFALGRNRNLQGLASSIVKLWEKSEVAKISIKRGVQNTNSEIMAEELKDLTGGTLLARDREFVTLYRGKDFLPLTVSSAIEERRKSAMQAKNTLLEETARNEVSVSEPSGIRDSEVKHQSVQKNTSSTEAYVKRTSTKLSMALEKKEKAERILVELEMREMRQQPEIDKEGISSEERYMLRKIGLRMKPFLLLGRRGVFDGTIENMHLHWKYRELVKIISDEKSIDIVQKEARTLEAESGGILVAVERANKGYAIIVYRGKNYSRPESLRPKTLLNKKAALKRSLEAQRRESLKLHVLKLGKNIDNLKGQLAKDKEIKKRQCVDESSQLVQEEAERIEPAEVSRRDPDVESTTSLDEIDEFKDMGSTVGIVGAQSVASDGDDVDYKDLDEDEDEDEDEDDDGDGDEDDDDDDDDDDDCDDDLDEDEDEDEDEDDDGDGDEDDDDDDCDDGDDVAIDSPAKSEASEPISVTMDEGQRKEMPPKPIFLSNKERLLLRQQALRMKYRPVLAVGRSNIITGIARTINAHFKKYPLAIVNIKGRAKGTSIREVVFMLEQATGGVLVSQEPSKVILYRGWGAGEGGIDKRRKNKNITPKNTTRVLENKRDNQPAVSPELLEAIRAECGLQNRLKEDKYL